MRLIEELATKITEGFQSSTLSEDTAKTNLFHRNVTLHKSTDISFIMGLVSTGLRGSVELNNDELLNNYGQLLVACKQHIPLVIHTHTAVLEKSVLGNLEVAEAVRQAGCPQFVASTDQEYFALTLIAHRVAELALTPVLLIKDYTEDQNKKVDFLQNHLVEKYLGSPEDQIVAPSPAQEIIFGEKRRRIPIWFNADTPLKLGGQKEGKALAWEKAAKQEYFTAHFSELIEQAFAEYNLLNKTNLAPVQVEEGEAYALIHCGATLETPLREVTEKMTQIKLLQLSPFPEKLIKGALKKKKAFTVFEQIGCQALEKEMTRLVPEVPHYVAKCGGCVTLAELEKAIGHMQQKQSPNHYYLGIEFVQKSEYPKQELLLGEIKKAYPDIATKTLNAKKEEVEQHQSIKNVRVPAVIRQYKDRGARYTQLARFHDNTTFFYQSGEELELVADPFVALPVVPASTACFHQTDASKLPIWNAQNCQACGDCFVQCPNTAIPPISIGVESLVRSAANIATKNGAKILKLTPLIKNLAKVAAKTLSEVEGGTAKDCLELAFKDLLEQMKLEGEKRTTIEDEFKQVLAVVNDFPLAITAHLFRTPNAREAGTGEFFSLTINPDACTGCGLCSKVCPENALSMETKTPEIEASARTQFQLWEELPDTPGDTIHRLCHEQDYSSLAAVLLSRSYYMSMVHTGSSSPETPYKTLLHLITATVESVVQPQVVQQIKHIEKLTTQLTELVHAKLSAALPKENLEALSSSLSTLSSKKMSLREIVNKFSAQETSLLDAEDLKRMTELVGTLNQLKWALEEGATGLGRARYGLVLSDSPSLAWAKQYPFNSFTSPVLVPWKGGGAEQIQGLFQGQLRYWLDNIKLLRRASLELQNKYESAKHDKQLAALSWEDLTEEEKERIPALVLVLEQADLNQQGWSKLYEILGGKLPVKVVLLDDALVTQKEHQTQLIQTTSGLIGAIALKNAYVFQGSMGNAEHFFNGLLEGLCQPTPALFSLYAAKREKHIGKYADWRPLATLATNSRAFPSLKYNPVGEAKLLSDKISLEGNQSDSADWHTEAMEGENGVSLNYTITWADWLYAQRNGQKEFTQVEVSDKNLALAEYLDLDSQNRKNKIPVLFRKTEKGIHYYAVSNWAVAMTEKVRANWNTWQEVAGMLTEFPTKIQAKIEQELKQKHEIEQATLQAKHEQELKEQAAQQTELLRQKLKEKLVTLATMAQKNA